ncbi:MAG: hypothetical protein LBT33_09745 [Spirochaetia bacterium]|jgi:ribonucleoside-triphosphate reductase|nr:hypothetical protein [Spirochaetia bacterium]
MRSVETITKEIEELKARLANVKGTQTEVYTRIVGYYRSLRNWNKGKREEYAQRLPFQVTARSARAADGPQEFPTAGKEAACGSGAVLKNIAGYRYFYRETCPNCPAVRDFVSRLPMEGQRIDVDTEDGLNEAMADDVQSTPTVVFYDSEGKPKLRGHSVPQLEELFAAV